MLDTNSCDWARFHNSWQVRISPVDEKIEPRNRVNRFHHVAIVDFLNVEVLVEIPGNVLFIPTSEAQLEFHRFFKTFSTFSLPEVPLSFDLNHILHSGRCHTLTLVADHIGVSGKFSLTTCIQLWCTYSP
jgi:hypothetical protein